jgi:hypothetical protein
MEFVDIAGIADAGVFAGDDVAVENEEWTTSCRKKTHSLEG